MKCICQTCDCGKHRCPHYMPERHTATSKEPCKVSEYRGEYQGGTKATKIILRRPADCLKPEGEPQFETTSSNDFLAYTAEPYRRKKCENVYTKATEPMQVDTEYGARYIQGKAEVIILPDRKKTQIYNTEEGPMEKSVTRTEFIKKVSNKPKVCKLIDNHISSNAPFESISVQHADFPKLHEPPRKSGRRPDNIKTADKPSCYDTTSKSHFPPHDQKTILHKQKKEVYEFNSEPFNAVSVSKADYVIPKEPIKSSIMRHENYLFATEDPMQDLTTSHDAYPNWGYQKVKPIKEIALYRPPSHEMDLQKTSDDYKNFGRTKITKSLRPKTNLRCDGNFGGLSIYQDVFIKYDIGPRAKPIVSRDTCYSSNVPFNARSESMEQFKKHVSAAPAKMTRRINEVFEKGAHFEDSTSYKDHFRAKELPECPSMSIIKSNFNGYDIVDDLNGGHRFFQKSIERDNNTLLPSISTGSLFVTSSL